VGKGGRGRGLPSFLHTDEHSVSGSGLPIVVGTCGGEFEK